LVYIKAGNAKKIVAETWVHSLLLWVSMSIDLKDAYILMTRIRAVEHQLLDLFSQGLLNGTIHTCLGQEAVAVGVVSQMDKSKDIICSNHRGHGHFLAYTENYKGLIAEIMGLPTGVCGGIGGSQHLHENHFYSNGILGGMSPVAVGMAQAEVLKQSGAVVIVFHGDGAMAQGVVYESMNLAALKALPYILCLEHNQYAQSTHWQLEHAGNLHERAEHFGLTVTVVDGNDIQAVSEAAKAVIAKARERQPQLLCLETYRMGPHSKGDDLRDETELLEYAKRCPLALLSERLDASWCAARDNEAKAFVAEIVNQITQEKALTQ